MMEVKNKVSLKIQVKNNPIEKMAVYSPPTSLITKLKL
jgi:hypothetical protein